LVRYFWLQAVFLWIPLTLVAGWFLSGPTVIDKKVLIVGGNLGLIALMVLIGKLANRHRRRILAEDGVSVKPLTPAEREDYFARIRLHGSKTHAFLYLGMACNMGGLVAVQIHHVRNGGVANPWLLAFLVGFTLFSSVQAWRNRPR
jgi:hypothetical protein